jgi:glycerol-3-phosphate dehydrogenase
MFHRQWREQALSSLGQPFDLVIIGGGITGCGVLLDAAQRGLRVLLVERQDIASGTSSRSSKLVHGGLRYLKQMQFRVTRMACRERDRMLSLNPHLVRPIRFVYPANRGDKTPGWTVDLGLWMYDRLTERPQKHSHLDGDELRRLTPGLRDDDLDRALAYTDAMTDDAQLTLAVAATGFAYGGLVLSRTDVLEATTDFGGRVNGVVLRDLESQKTATVEAGLVVNATGHWVDRLRKRFGFSGAMVRPSRGTHIVLPTSRLPVTAAVTLPAPDDGRPVFVIPHPEGVLAGTTDIYHDGSLTDPRPTRGEIDYLLRTLAFHFPDNGIVAADVVGAFAGLRPILDSHTDNPSEASREEAVWEENGLLSVAGGKLTTWRPTAEEVVDEALHYLPSETARRAAPCLTAGTPLVGLAPPDLARRLESVAEVPAVTATAMARRLRGLAWTAPRLARSAGELQPIDGTDDLSVAELRTHLRLTAVVRLEDLLLRRVRLGLWRPDEVAGLLPSLEPICREELAWNIRRWEREATTCLDAVEAWSPAGALPDPPPAQLSSEHE